MLQFSQPYKIDKDQLQYTPSLGPYRHKTCRRKFIQQNFTAGGNVIAPEIFRACILCEELSKELPAKID
jgi:hypothetical protein